MDWIVAHSAVVSIGLTLFSVATVLVLVFVKPRGYPTEVPLRIALGAVAIVALVSAAFVFIGSSGVGGPGGLGSGCNWQSVPVQWDNNGLGHDAIPESGGDLQIEAPACSTTLLDGPSFLLDDGTSCAGGSVSLCVAVWQTTNATSIAVHQLQPGDNFYGVTASDYQSAVQDKASKWWVFPNCTQGCQGAYVTVFVDGARIRTNAFISRS